MGLLRLGVVVFAAGVLAAAPAWDVGFIADDLAIVQVVERGPGDAGLFDEGLPPEVWGILRPVGFWDFFLETRLAGLDDRALRISQQMLHGLNAVLVLAVGLALGLGPSPAAVAAGLFAVHPANAQVLAFLGCRFDQLALFFSLASILCFHAGVTRGRRGALILSFVCFVLALGSKESAGALPAILLVVRGISVRSLVAITPFVFWTGLWFAARAWLVGAGAARPGVPEVPSVQQIVEGLRAAIELVVPVDQFPANVSMLILLGILLAGAGRVWRKARAWTGSGGGARTIGDRLAVAGSAGVAWCAGGKAFGAGLLWILPVTPLLARQAGLEDARLVHGALPWFLLGLAALVKAIGVAVAVTGAPGPGAARPGAACSAGAENEPTASGNGFADLADPASSSGPASRGRLAGLLLRSGWTASAVLFVVSFLSLASRVLSWRENANDCQDLVEVAHEIGRRSPGAFLSLDAVPLMRDRAWMYAGGFQLISDGFAVVRGASRVPTLEVGADLTSWIPQLSSLEVIDMVLLSHDRGVLRGGVSDLLDPVRLSSQVGSSWSWLAGGEHSTHGIEAPVSLTPTSRPGVLGTGGLALDFRAGAILEIELSLPRSARTPLAPCRLRWQSRLPIFTDLLSIPFPVVADGRTRRYRLHLPPAASWSPLENSLAHVAGASSGAALSPRLRAIQLELPTAPATPLRLRIATGP